MIPTTTPTAAPLRALRRIELRLCAHGRMSAGRRRRQRRRARTSRHSVLSIIAEVRTHVPWVEYTVHAGANGPLSLVITRLPLGRGSAIYHGTNETELWRQAESDLLPELRKLEWKESAA